MGDDSDAVVREQAVATNMVRMNVGVDEKFDVFVCQRGNFFKQLRHRRLEMESTNSTPSSPTMTPTLPLVLAAQAYTTGLEPGAA